MAEKVRKVGIERKGKLLFVDKQGDISQLKPRKKVKKLGIEKEKGYLYFVDKQGDVSRAKAGRK